MGVTSATTTSTPPVTVRDLLSGRFEEELIRRNVEIPQRRTRPGDFMVRCPLPNHAERTPSCHLTLRHDDAGREVWVVSCFGCGFVGDDVALLAVLDGQTVEDWMRAYRDRNGQLDPPPQRPTRPVPPAPVAPGCTSVELHGYLDDCHEALLAGPDSGAARRYARERGLRAEEVRLYRVGYGLPTPLKAIPQRPPWSVVGRLIFPVPGGLEARDVTGNAEHKYIGKNVTADRKVAWGVNALDAARSPMLLVEGILDGIACRRINWNTIALRGKTLHEADAERLAAAGFADAYICLDSSADVKVEQLQAIGGRLAAVGVRPWITRGHPDSNDFGSYLTESDDALTAAFAEAVRLP